MLLVFGEPAMTRRWKVKNASGAGIATDFLHQIHAEIRCQESLGEKRLSTLPVPHYVSVIHF